MNGFQLTFFTRQDRRHGGQPLAHWLLAFAQAQGALGGTLLDALAKEPIDLFSVKQPVEFGRVGARAPAAG